MNNNFYQLTISEVSTLTPEAVAIRLSVPEELKETFHFIQGQHLIVKAIIDGEEVRRSYSVCSDVKDQELQVGIKRVSNGVFSNYANDHLKAGMTLDVMAPQGHFYTELSPTNKNNYLCMAAGSGITPVLSQIQSILSVEPESRVTLIFVNKSTSLMMFRNKLGFIKNQYMDRFQWVNLFTNEEHEATIFNGRVSAKKIAELDKTHVIRLQDTDEVFMCGPENMIKEVTPYLESTGIGHEHIHYELFYADSAERKTLEKQQQRKEKFGDQMSNVAVKISGRRIRFDLSVKGENILDAAIHQGAELPFSCKVGVCATCKAKLRKGEVEMDQNHSLSEEEIADGIILTCQAHPVSDDVEVDFDII